MKSVLAHTAEELSDALAASGLEAYRGRQVARWVLGRRVRDFEDMTDLGKPLRSQLAAAWSTRSLCLRRAERARDGTEKLVLETADGASIESVLIPDDARLTLCVSSQVGCSLDCSFCATGRLGLGRNLRADEIVDQVLLAAERAALADGREISHVVFMGMGEPLANFAQVVQAIRVLTDPGGFALAPRRITVSTAGIATRIPALAEALDVRLAVSLHAPDDALRDRLVPLNRRFPIAVLMDAVREYARLRGERVSFEYTLIDGVNDRDVDADGLVRLLSGLRALVNLIPLNPHPGAPELRRPSDVRVDAFAGRLARAGVNVTVRRSRGDDIFAACGQLGALAPDAAAASTEAPGR